MSKLFFRMVMLLVIVFTFTSPGVFIYSQVKLASLQNKIRYDDKTKLPKVLYNVHSRRYTGSPADIAKEYLNENKLFFKLKEKIDDLKIERIQASPAGYHVGFRQNLNGIPVLGSETIVSINNENRISMVVNGYKPNITVNTTPDIPENEAIQLAKKAVNFLQNKEVVSTKVELVIYQDSTLSFSLVWKITIQSNDKLNSFITLTDAHSGATLKVWNSMLNCSYEIESNFEKDRSLEFNKYVPWNNKDYDYLVFTETLPELLTPPMTYVNGTGRVFDPDPVTAIHDPNLIFPDYHDSDYTALAAAYDIVTLNELNNTPGNYKLQGRYAHSMNICYVEPPYPKIYVTSDDPNDFIFNRSQYGFEEVNAYYFIDKMRRYVGGLGFYPKWAYLGYNSEAIAFDVLGSDSQFSGYNPDSEYLLYGAPLNDYDVAEDQCGILHEYGHALHDALLYGGFENCTLGDLGGITEGIADYLAISYRRSTQMGSSNPDYPPYKPNARNNWFDSQLANSIQLVETTQYPAQWVELEAHLQMYLWASTLMDIEYNVSTDPTAGINLGRDVTTKLLLTSLHYVTYDEDIIDNVFAILQADRDIYNGSHLSALTTVFYNRGFFSGTEVSGNISTNTTWSDNKYVSGNIIVNSGVTLTISPNTYLFFNNGSSLIVNGTLTAIGNAINKITFDGNGTTGSWGGIIFNSGSSGSIEYCNISHATTGITCSSTLPMIRYNTISNNTTGISVSSVGTVSNEISYNTIQDNTSRGINLAYSSPKIYNNTISNNAYYGISTYNSSPYLSGNTITGHSSSGLNFSYYSSARLVPWNAYGYYWSAGNNIIKDNFGYGISSSYWSNLYLGSYPYGGYNCINDNTVKEMTAAYNCTILAQSNWWGTTSPNSSDIYAYQSTVDYSLPLQTDPCLGIENISIDSNNPIILSKQNNGLTDLDNAYKLQLEGRFGEAIALYDSYINVNSTDSKSALALVRIDECYKLSGSEGAVTYLDNTIKTKANKNNELDVVSHELKNQYLIQDKKYEEAVNNFNELAKKFKTNKDVEKHSLFNAGYVYLKYLNDYKKATEKFAELAEKYPADELVSESEYLLGNLDANNQQRLASPNASQSDLPVPTEYALDQNYPNPFNPATTITYELPKNGSVTLKIFDILGNEVKILVNEQKAMGRYTVQFDASSLASGMYVYQLRVNDYTSTKKMLLLK